MADCLETTVEVGQEYKNQFDKLGTERWDLFPSLNSRGTWVECVKDLGEQNS